MSEFMKYPELGKILQLQYEGVELLGVTLYWEEKRDGSNTVAYLVDGALHLGSRHQADAAKDMLNAFGRTVEAPKVGKLLDDNPTFKVFGEMLIKGKSPTKIEMHETDEFITFDIYDSKSNRFLSYNRVKALCNKYELPMVKLWARTKHESRPELYFQQSKMLDKAKEEGREGVVIKAYPKKGNPIYAKARRDDYKPEPKELKPDKPYVPPLNDGEIYGAIDKAYVDLGLEKFKEVKTAMPLVAKYTQEECRKHDRGMPRNLFKFYSDYLHRKVSGT